MTLRLWGKEKVGLDLFFGVENVCLRQPELALFQKVLLRANILLIDIAVLSLLCFQGLTPIPRSLIA